MKLRNCLPVGLSIIVFMCFFLVNCSRPVYVQKDNSINWSNYHNYMWVDTRANENDKSARAVSYADISMRNAVNEELNKLGWREVNDNPDVFLSYDILVERSVEQRSDPVYTQPYSRVYYNPYMRRWGSIYYPPQLIGYQNYETPVKEGTITISMMDARTDKIIWQGWTTENMNYSRLTD